MRDYDALEKGENPVAKRRLAIQLKQLKACLGRKKRARLEKALRLKRDIEAYRNDDLYRRALNTMVVHNLPLVVKLTRRHDGKGNFLDRMDRIQNAALRMLERDIHQFDPARGYRFCTYVGKRVRGGASRDEANLESTVRVPVHTQRDYAAIKRAEDWLVGRLRIDDPTSEELADAVNLQTLGVARRSRVLDLIQGQYLRKLTEPEMIELKQALERLGRTPMDAARVERTLRHMRSRFTVATDKVIHFRPVASGDEEFPVRLGDLLQYEDGCGIPRDSALSLIRSQAAAAVEREMAQLNPKEHDVLRRHIMGDEHETLQDIGRDWGVSGESIRRVEKRTLGRLAKRLRNVA